MLERALLLAASTALAAIACAGQPAGSPDQGRALLEQRQAAFLAGLEARDPDAMAALFSDDAVMHVAGMPSIRGRVAIRQFYGNLFGFLAESTAAPESTRVSASGDLAYTTGTTTNAFRGPDGAVEYTGKFVLVWEKLADDWSISVYSVSGDEP